MHSTVQTVPSCVYSTDEISQLNIILCHYLQAERTVDCGIQVQPSLTNAYVEVKQKTTTNSELLLRLKQIPFSSILASIQAVKLYVFVLMMPNLNVIFARHHAMILLTKLNSCERKALKNNNGAV